MTACIVPLTSDWYNACIGAFIGIMTVESLSTLLVYWLCCASVTDRYKGYMNAFIPCWCNGYIEAYVPGCYSGDVRPPNMTGVIAVKRRTYVMALSVSPYVAVIIANWRPP
jgi:hypothetical protein